MRFRTQDNVSWSAGWCIGLRVACTIAIVFHVEHLYLQYCLYISIHI